MIARPVARKCKTKGPAPCTTPPAGCTASRLKLASRGKAQRTSGHEMQRARAACRSGGVHSEGMKLGTYAHARSMIMVAVEVLVLVVWWLPRFQLRCGHLPALQVDGDTLHRYASTAANLLAYLPST